MACNVVLFWSGEEGKKGFHRFLSFFLYRILSIYYLCLELFNILNGERGYHKYHAYSATLNEWMMPRVMQILNYQPTISKGFCNDLQHLICGSAKLSSKSRTFTWFDWFCTHSLADLVPRSVSVIQTPSCRTSTKGLASFMEGPVTGLQIDHQTMGIERW